MPGSGADAVSGKPPAGSFEGFAPGSGPRMIYGPRLGEMAPAHWAEAYAWPSGRRWLRAMMVTTLDGGAVGPDGRSGSISSRTDRAVMREARRLSDVVLIGASTFRVERYRAMRSRPDDVAERLSLGLSEAPVLAIVSASLDLPWQEEAFRDSTHTPIVVTTERADRARVEVARQHADVVELPGAGADPTQILEVLNGRGLRRVVCEGGPRLLAGFARAGLLDEADIAMSPLVAGGGQIPTGIPAATPTAFRLAHVILADGFLFNRYVATAGDRTGGTE